ncbi:MAG: hypothetical protein OEY95_00355 [Candidatus Bathyarchaeota archaeon]|nr:hypothetical protein [Candidatus Bathyarchaeota archaeon]MDH5753651.1 hypothetical protein [Candidatus Bathyarchaeota archaeon]
MRRNKRLTTKDVALIVCFSALYTVFCLFPIFQIVGLPSKSITMAAIIAPIIGILLGPYLGALSTILGGTIGLFAGHFSSLSFVSGVVAAFSAGTLYFGKRSLCAFTYFSLLFFFGFYPFVGPVWLCPQLMWFQIVGFLILVSPLQSMAVKNMWISKNNTELVSAYFITSLTSTLAGQIAGSLAFEAQFSWPISVLNINAWKLDWQFLTWIYPGERVIIALATAFIGVALHRVLKSANLMRWFNV